MIDTLHIDDLDGAVTLFKSTDKGTETIAVFDEEHREVIQDLLAEVKRLCWALAYTASLLTCRIEGDDIPVIDIREYALDVVDMTVDEAMATTDLMEESE